MNSEQLAKLFHENYERLAPAFGYSTRKSSRVKWERVPQKNRALMIAVSQTVLNTLLGKESPATGTQQANTAICPNCHQEAGVPVVHVTDMACMHCHYRWSGKQQ